LDIFILRHGDANTQTKKLIDDSKRSLSENGIREIESVSRLFAEFEMRFDFVLSSPLKRARQTSDIILKGQKKCELVELNELKPEGNLEELCKKLAKHVEGSVILIVGHNPLLTNLTNYIVGSNHLPSGISLKTGGLIKIKTTSFEPKLRGHLEWLLTPKLIRKVSK
jgi:phosphohistidine phosphatase